MNSAMIRAACVISVMATIPHVERTGYLVLGCGSITRIPETGGKKGEKAFWDRHPGGTENQGCGGSPGLVTGKLAHSAAGCGFVETHGLAVKDVCCPLK